MTRFQAIKLRCRHRASRLLFSAGLLVFAEVVAIADGSVQLAWDPSTDTNVIGYNVYYGLASRTYTFAVSAGSATNATVLGLREGNTYYFATLALTGGGAFSDFSDEVSQYIPITNKSATAFAAVSGAYNGLFFNAEQIGQSSAGFFSLFVNARGVYSGYLQSGSIRASFGGQLDPWRRGTNVVAGPNNSSFMIQFRIGTNGKPGKLVGQVSNGMTVSSLVADRASCNASTLPDPFAGQYTCALPGEGTDPFAPRGYGFAVAHVTTSGSAFLAGTLADGTRFSQSAPISDGGTWPFYAPLYSGKGSVISLLRFTHRMNDDLNGVMNWIKPGTPNARYYSAGFTNQSDMIGSSYTMPSPSTEPVLGLPKTSIAFIGGELGSGFTNAISIGRSSRVANQSPNSLSMTFSLSTGCFRGNVVDPVSGSAMPFSGIVFQKITAGYGLLLGTDQTSSVLLGN